MAIHKEVVLKKKSTPLMTTEIDQYLSHIKYVRRYSHHTVIAYWADLVQFKSFCKKHLLEVVRADVREFLRHLKESGYSPSSVNRKFEVLRSFYRFYRRFTPYKQFPCAHIRPVRFVKPRGKYLTKERINEVLDAIEYKQCKRLLRDRLVLEFLYQTGCRSNELINLKKNQVDSKHNLIRLIGKGNIERAVPVGKRLKTLIVRYLKLGSSKNTTSYLFTTNSGKQIYPMYLWRLIKKYFPNTDVSAHTLRHSCATHLYHNRAPIKAIRDLLGHRSLKSTEAYLHLNIKHLIKVHAKAHPRTRTAHQ